MPIPRRPFAGRQLLATRRLVLLVAGVAGSLAIASVAVAFWTSDGQGTGKARAATFDLEGVQPKVRAIGQDVSVSWKQGRQADQWLGNHSAGGYIVRRYDTHGRSQQIRTACAGRMAGSGRVLRCVELAVPEGTWKYTVTPVLGGWTGEEGPHSTVTIAAAGTVAVSTPEDGSATRDTRPTIAGTAGSDPGDAMQVTVTLFRGRDLDDIARRFTTTVSDGAWSVRPATPLREGIYTVRAGQAEPEGHTSWSTPSSFRVDASAPSTEDDTRELGEGWHRTTQKVTLSPDDPGGSGVTATYYTTNGLAPTTSSRQGIRVTVRAEGVHAVRYFSVDRAGNAEAVATATRRIRIDRTPPSTVELDPLPEMVADGQALAGSANDALSGIAELGFEYCPTTDCGTWTSIGAGDTWDGQPADGTYRIRARALDRAGNVGVSDTQTVRVDNTPPVVTALAGGDGDGRVEAGDTLVVTFSEPLDPDSVPSAGRLTLNRPKDDDTTLHLPGVTAAPDGTGTRAWVKPGRSVTYAGTIALEDGGQQLRFTVTACKSGCRKVATGEEGTLRFVPAGSLRDRAGHAAAGSKLATLTLL